MARVDWQYIAGFFDGEGCVSLVYGAAIAQKDRRPLKQIQEFLAEHGIFTTIGNPIRRDQVWYLKIMRKEALKQLLLGIRPWVIVKKQLTEDIWRFLVLFPAMLKSTTVAAEYRWRNHTRQTSEERRAHQRKQKNDKYRNDPNFRQRCIDEARKRTREKLNGGNGA